MHRNQFDPQALEERIDDPFLNHIADKGQSANATPVRTTS
jgi:hypothetical protein